MTRGKIYRAETERRRGRAQKEQRKRRERAEEEQRKRKESAKKAQRKLRGRAEEEQRKSRGRAEEERRRRRESSEKQRDLHFFFLVTFSRLLRMCLCPIRETPAATAPEYSSQLGRTRRPALRAVCRRPAESECLHRPPAPPLHRRDRTVLANDCPPPKEERYPPS